MLGKLLGCIINRVVWPRGFIGLGAGRRPRRIGAREVGVRERRR